MKRKPQTPAKEVRIGVVNSLEYRAAAEGGNAVLAGYAAKFLTLSSDLGGFREQILPGAFTTSIAEHDIRALVNHESGLSTIGRNTAGTLELEQDNVGLRIAITPPDTSAGRDICELVKRGDISQMSFGFSVMPDGDSWEEKEDGTIVRSLSNVRLFEVSPVTFPAYADTEIAQRSLDVWKEQNKPQLLNSAAWRLKKNGDLQLRTLKKTG